jgi:two-component system osmolarity sensor histidine kinase EnvZ
MPNIKVNTDLEADVLVLGNAIDLRRVINNVVENARRYARTPGEDVTEIDISCHVRPTGHGRRAIITLQDHGPGVPEDQIGQLLKPFTRLDTANGAGLGLAIVDRVLSRHNAELTLRNRQGGGLVVQLALPLAT